MGVVISTESTLSPISVASITIGFVSFAFTLGTFLKVVWVNLETVSEPAHNVHTMLNQLREELVEERASLRVLRKVNKSRRRSKQKLPGSLEDLFDLELNEATIKTMSDSIKQLCKQFQHLERPFLKDGEDGIQQSGRRTRKSGDMSPSPHYDHSAYAPYEKRPRSQRRQTHEPESEDDMFWVQRVQYGEYGLRRRLDWLYLKSKVQAMFEALSRVQTRRIARQVNGVSLMLREYGEKILHSSEQMDRLDHRLSRVIGMRRIE